MLSVIIQLGVTGLAMGMIYALLSMGLVLLIRAVGVMNFAQGDLLMLGAYITYGFSVQAKMSFIPMFFCSLLSFVAFAVIFMFTVYWPTRRSTWPVAVIICTIGASIAIKEGVQLIWGRIALTMPALVSGSMRLGNVILEYQYLLIIAVSAIIVFLVFTLFDKLYVGRCMQAAAQDKYMAELLGIPTIITIGATYAIVMSVAGTAGYLVAPLFLVQSSLGLLQLKAFAGVVLGGYGNLKGAVLGSLIIGLIESCCTIFTTTYRDAVVFLVLILVLVFRPQGIFGERIADKA